MFREWTAFILCFERPIPLWQNIFDKLTEAKKYLTPRLWTKYITTAYNKIEYESITQAFRCVGSRTKGNSYAMAFKCGDKVTIEYMNSFYLTIRSWTVFINRIVV